MGERTGRCARAYLVLHEANLTLPEQSQVREVMYFPLPRFAG